MGESSTVDWAAWVFPAMSCRVARSVDWRMTWHRNCLLHTGGSFAAATASRPTLLAASYRCCPDRMKYFPLTVTDENETSQ